MNAMFPANKDKYSPQPHQDGIPVVVMAQERGDEEWEEDRNRPGKKQPREAHLPRYRKNVTASCVSMSIFISNLQIFSKQKCVHAL